MGVIDYALRESQPEKTVRYPSPCPTHPNGDEARLDYRAEGWPELCSRKHRGGCIRKWRVTVLCDGPMMQAFYCDRTLPAELRRLVAS